MTGAAGTVPDTDSLTPLRLLREARVLTEWRDHRRDRWLLDEAPTGDGHVVIVLPGLLTSDRATHPLRHWLEERGWDARGWQQGRNLGRLDLLETLPELVEATAAESGQRVSLVGWSLGGTHARWVAHRCPDAVRRVITLGSPFRIDPRDTPAWPLLSRLSGASREDLDDEILSLVAIPPPVPTTSIASLDDGVAPPEVCTDDGPDVDRVLVRGSHLGLIRNPVVWRAIADRLANRPGPIARHLARRRSREHRHLLHRHIDRSFVDGPPADPTSEDRSDDEVGTDRPAATSQS